MNGRDLYYLLAAFLQSKLLAPNLTATLYHKPLLLLFPIIVPAFTTFSLASIIYTEPS